MKYKNVGFVIFVFLTDTDFLSGKSAKSQNRTKYEFYLSFYTLDQNY
jgi:hypothetical protein